MVSPARGGVVVTGNGEWQCQMTRLAGGEMHACSEGAAAAWSAGLARTTVCIALLDG
ncbi:hypothetical protein SAMN05216499_13035 [Actinacidiphila paucisporea]|uniref:Uncharacterized protein n=1 Tax=Actinacidiphila paucisporea TaxID=310782 RepID=A0A1M7Q7R5_9ACTN|nr:hypothetical protein SAMN05216499_13035 [Actinacidiphila paucisporea]